MTDDYQIESMVTITGAEYVRLTAEIERLRAALEKENRWIIDERDRTFALMLGRAEKAEAENAKLRAALTEIRDAGPMTLDDQRWRIALAVLEGPQDRMAKPLGGDT